jgi:hypothetical protein
MAFWSTADVDPKRQHRWLIEIGNGDISGQAAYICKKVNKPKVSVNAAEHKFLNHTFYYPGNVTYEPVTATFVDPGNPHTTNVLYSILQQSGYKLPSDITNVINSINGQAATVGKAAGTTALNSVNIIALDGNGYQIEKTILKNPWISSIDFGGELSYDADGMMEITMEVRFDWIEIELGTGGNSIVGNVAQGFGNVVDTVAGAGS